MIELSTNTALMLYLGITLITLMVIWASRHFRSRRQKPLATDQQLLVCEFCHFAYLDDMGKSITKCPQCGSFNK